MIPDEEFQSLKLAELRAAVNDVAAEVTEAEMLRFLRARNYDMKKAEEMLRKSIEWRATVHLKEALSYEFSDTLIQSFPFYIDGKGKDGRPAFYFPAGRWEVRQMISDGWKDEMYRYLYHSMASIVSKLDETGVDKFIVIIDLALMSYWKIAHYETMQMILRTFREYEQNFPERLHQAIVINAPWVLNYIFPLIKPILNGSTLEKVQIFDASPEKYLPAIYNDVPETSLPSKLMDNVSEFTKK